MKNICVLMAFLIAFSCSKEESNIVKDEQKEKEIQRIYSFKKNGKTSVDFYKERVLIDMHSILERNAKNALYYKTTNQELNNNMKNIDKSFSYEHRFLRIFNSAEVLNKEKELKIYDFLSASKLNSSNQDAVRLKITNFFQEIEKINEHRRNPASKGNPGYLFYGKNYDKRLVNSNGIETVQEMTKSLMGAFQLDQIINHHLEPKQLNLDNTKNVAGKNYTLMEHNWDQAFALTGLPADSELNYLGDNASSDEKTKYGRFWSEYIYRVDKTPAGKNIKKEIYNAFILGRQAIVDKNYSVRDTQANKLKKLLTKVCAIRAAYYLKRGVLYLNEKDLDRKGDAAHNISEGLGFAYSLRFAIEKTNYDTKINAIKENGGLWKEDIVSKVQHLNNQIMKDYTIESADL